MYCIYCGTKNDEKNKLCKKCLRKLNPKDHPLKEYLRSKGIGECEEHLSSMIKTYIRTHLYGFVLACSVLITAVTMTVSVLNKHQAFEVVAEKPKEVIVYVGEGLTGEEVVKKYIDAILNDDIKTVRNLQLESFYPNVRESIKDRSSAAWVENPIMEHDLVEYGKYYVKDAIKLQSKDNPLHPYQLSKATDLNMAEDNRYGDYTYERYYFVTYYCEFHVCKQTYDDAITLDGHIRDLIEVIEVDGNFYVNGEMMGPFMGEDQWIFHRYIQIMKGDTSKLSVEVLDYLSKECLEDDSCLEESGLK